MGKRTKEEYHRLVSDIVYNIESGSRDWRRDFVKGGIKTEAMTLIESSREQLHGVIDELYELEAADIALMTPINSPGFFTDNEFSMLVAGLNAKIKKTRQSMENDIRNVTLETDEKVLGRIEYRKSEIAKYEALKLKIDEQQHL